MTFQPYKFIVQAVIQNLDNEGNVIGESQVEPVVVFGCADLERWARDFSENLEKAELRINNGNG